MPIKLPAGHSARERWQYQLRRTPRRSKATPHFTEISEARRALSCEGFYAIGGLVKIKSDTACVQIIWVRCTLARGAWIRRFRGARHFAIQERQARRLFCSSWAATYLPPNRCGQLEHVAHLQSRDCEFLGARRLTRSMSAHGSPNGRRAGPSVCLPFGPPRALAQDAAKSHLSESTECVLGVSA
jgi:hypothetical protein